MNKQNLLSTHNLFTFRLLLSLLGAYIGYIYRHESHDYWLVMMFLFSVIALTPGYYQFKQHGENFKALISRLLHWAGGLTAAIIVYVPITVPEEFSMKRPV